MPKRLEMASFAGSRETITCVVAQKSKGVQTACIDRGKNILILSALVVLAHVEAPLQHTQCRRR